MSEITRAVICMPYELAMESELSRRQFLVRAQWLLADHDALRAELDKEQRRARVLEENCAELAIEVERLRAVASSPVPKQEAWHIVAINAGIDAADSGKLADFLEVKADWERRAATRTDTP